MEVHLCDLPSLQGRWRQRRRRSRSSETWWWSSERQTCWEAAGTDKLYIIDVIYHTSSTSSHWQCETLCLQPSRVVGCTALICQQRADSYFFIVLPALGNTSLSLQSRLIKKLLVSMSWKIRDKVLTQFVSWPHGSNTDQAILRRRSWPLFLQFQQIPRVRIKNVGANL